MINAERIQGWPSRDLSSTLATAALVLAAVIVVSAPALTISFVAVAGIATVLLSLINPLFGLGALILSIPFGSLGQDPAGGLAVTPTEIITGILVFTWLGKGIRQRELKITAGPLAIPIMLFIGLLFLSMTYSASLPLSLKEMVKWLELLVVYLFVVNCVTDRRQVKAVLVMLAIAAVGEALIGYYQFLGRVGPDSFKIGSFLRAYGTFGQPNPFAGYLTPVAILALSLTLVSLVKRPRAAAGDGRGRELGLPWWLVLFFLGSFGLISTAILLSLSRGAWIGFAVGAAVVGAVSSRATLMALIVLVILLSLVVLAGSSNLLPDQISGRMSQSLDYFRLFDASRVNAGPDNWALVERMANWQAAWGMHERYSWFGVGVGNFAIAYPDFALKFWQEPKGHAHNVYLNMLAEMGVVGLGAYLALLATFFFHAVGTVRRTLASLFYHEDSPTRREGARALIPAPRVNAGGVVYAAVAIGLLGALVAISLHNLFDSLFVHGMSAQIGLMLGLITVVGRLSSNANSAIRGSTLRR